MKKEKSIDKIPVFQIPGRQVSPKTGTTTPIVISGKLKEHTQGNFQVRLQECVKIASLTFNIPDLLPRFGFSQLPSIKAQQLHEQGLATII